MPLSSGTHDSEIAWNVIGADFWGRDVTNQKSPTLSSLKEVGGVKQGGTENDEKSAPPPRCLCIALRRRRLVPGVASQTAWSRMENGPKAKKLEKWPKMENCPRLETGKMAPKSVKTLLGCAQRGSCDNTLLSKVLRGFSRLMSLQWIMGRRASEKDLTLSRIHTQARVLSCFMLNHLGGSTAR